jgi:AbiV family abortive infection protein
MQQLSIEQLHRLRLQIFDNAESLHKESRLLFDAGLYARSYLLAYFACEELGKLPIIVGVVGAMMKKEPVDWSRTLKRLRDHKSKVDSDDFHQYVFGKELDLLKDADIKWLDEARANASRRVVLKNNSTYVDVVGETIISPLQAITKEDAATMIERAFESLRAHWHAESMVNPILRDMRNRAGLDDPLGKPESEAGKS